MSVSKIFLYLCLSFIGGIFLNSIFQIPQLLLLGFLILGIFLISVSLSLSLKRKAVLMIIGFCLLFLVLGIWRHQIAEKKITNNELRQYNEQYQKTTLTGQIIKEPDIREKNIKLTIKLDNLDGKILVTTTKYSQYQYGDKLKITGELLTPEEFPDFNYKDYLAKEGIYSVVYFPEIELIKKIKEILFILKF